MIPPLKKLPKTDYHVHHKYTRAEKEDVKKLIAILSILIAASIALLLYLTAPTLPTAEELLQQETHNAE